MIALQYWRVYAKGCPKLDIYTNYKNLLNFIIIKELNRRQIKWFELLKEYKFKIYYTLKKENDRANTLNHKCNYIKIKEKFDQNILRINENNTLLSNHEEITTIMRIIKNNKEQFSIQKGKLQISKKKINKYIKKHHDDSLQRYSRTIKTLQFLWQHYQFSHMRQKVETYIEKCFNC